MSKSDPFLQTLKHVPQSLQSLNQHNRILQLNQLAESTKKQIQQTIDQYQRILKQKEYQSLNDVDNLLFNTLKNINSLHQNFEQQNMSRKVDDRMIFSEITENLSSIVLGSSNQKAIQKLEHKLQEAIINQQRMKEKLEEVKRKYRNSKNKSSSTPLPLPLPPPSVLSNRYRRENEMLIEQNNILSNRLIEIQSQKWKCQNLKVDDTDRIQNAKYNKQQTRDMSNFNNQEVKSRERDLIFQIESLREQLSCAKTVLQQKEGLMSEKNRLLEMETERTYYQAERAQGLTSTLQSLKKQNQQLNDQINKLNQKIQQMQFQNKQHEKQRVGLVRKQILEDVMKQLNHQLKITQSLRQEYNSIRGKLMSKESQFRSKQIQYAQKMDQYSIINEKQYQDMKKSYQKKIEEMQSEAGNTISKLRKEMILTQEASRIRQQQSIRLGRELESTKDQLKVTKKVKKQSVAKKHLVEKQSLKEQYLTQIKMLNDQVSKFKLQYKTLKQSYENKMRLMDTKLKMMKQRFQIDIISKLDKSKHKGSRIEAMQAAESLIESFGNFVHKQSIISKLNKELNELKLKKQKEKEKQKNIKPNHQHSQLNMVVKEEIHNLNSEIFEERLKIQKTIIQQKKQISQQKLLKTQALNQNLEIKISELQQALDSANHQTKQLQKKIKQLEKQRQKQREREKAQVSSHRDQNDKELRQQLQGWKVKFNEVRKQREDLQNQNRLKKQTINNLKSSIKQSEIQIINQKKMNDDVRQQVQKLKKNIKQFQRKQQVYKQNKEKLQNIRSLEKQNQELKKELDDKNRTFKLEICKKDSIIKGMKQKQAAEMIKQSSRIQVQNNDVLRLEQQTRKLKNQLDRKDELVKIYKEKIQKLEEQIQKNQRVFQEKSHKEKTQSIRWSKKYDQISMENKKLQSQIFPLKVSLKKVLDSYCKLKEMNKPKKKQQKQIHNLQMFSEGLSILNISAQDIKQFLPSNQKQSEQQQLSLDLALKKLQEVMQIVKQQIDY